MYYRRLLFSIIPFIFCLLFIQPFQAKAAGEPYAWPVKGPVVMRFRAGYWDPTDSKTRNHCGIDIKGCEGTPVYAAADGVVAFAGNTPAGGLTLSVKHAGGIRTTYLPLKEILVGRGYKVKKGQQIAVLAAAGDKSSNETHLHMGAILAGEYIDPESLLSGEFKIDMTRLVRLGNIPISGASFPGFTGDLQESFKVMSQEDRSWWEQFVDLIMSLPDAAWDFFNWLLSQSASVGNWLIRLCTTGGEFVLRQFLWVVRGLYMSFTEIRRLIIQFISDRISSGADYLNIGGYGLPGFTVGAGGGIQVSRQVFDPSGDQSEERSKVRIFVDGEGADSAYVYGEGGRQVRDLGYCGSGKIALTWDGSDDTGRIVPEGPFYITIMSNGKARQEMVEVRYHLAGES